MAMKPTDRYNSLFEFWWLFAGSFHGRAIQDPIDWRLPKALCEVESHFNPDAESGAGAIGLLQLMPMTAQELGVQDRRNPEESIKGGCEYLWRQWTIFKAEWGWERWRFAIAAYNAGAGHVIAAQALAKRAGQPTDLWASVVEYLPQRTGEINARQTRQHVERVGEAYRRLMESSA